MKSAVISVIKNQNSGCVLFSSHKTWRIKRIYGELLKNLWFHFLCFLFIFLIISNSVLFQSNLLLFKIIEHYSLMPSKEMKWGKWHEFRQHTTLLQICMISITQFSIFEGMHPKQSTGNFYTGHFHVNMSFSKHSMCHYLNHRKIAHISNSENWAN